MGKYQFVHHRNECHLQGIFPDEFLGTAALVLQMPRTSKCRILDMGGIIHPAFMWRTTLSAEYLPGHGVSCLVLGITPGDTFFLCTLFHQCRHRLEILVADDGIVVSFHIKLIHLAVIRVPVEPLIRVCLLENAVSSVFFVGKDATDGSGCPFTALLGRRTQFYEFGCYRIRTLAGESFGINESDPFGLFFVNRPFAIADIIVTIWWVRQFEGAVLKAAANAPLAVFGNGDRFALGKA